MLGVEYVLAPDSCSMRLMFCMNVGDRAREILSSELVIVCSYFIVVHGPWSIVYEKAYQHPLDLCSCLPIAELNDSPFTTPRPLPGSTVSTSILHGLQSLVLSLR